MSTDYESCRAALIDAMRAEYRAHLAMSRALVLYPDDMDHAGRITGMPGIPLYFTTLEAATELLPLFTDQLLFYEWQNAITLETHCPESDRVLPYTQARVLAEAEILHRITMSGERISLAAWIGQATSVWGRGNTTPFALTMLWGIVS